MKLLKPSWVNHEGHPIFSVDIHPDMSRFATGGQGDDAGRIIIWNMGPVVKEEEEHKESIPKILCQMDNHLACVNVVRWSNNGKYLASAGDDKVVMIWQIFGYSVSSSFGSGLNVEQWRCVNTLRGHSGDILDMNWSPENKYLATCSVDNTVVIWNASKFPEVAVILKGHSGFVKGVCWDPIGKYLASQSDDKSVKIWRVSDWKEEVTIKEPFQECGGTTHVLRLHWSVDGQYLISAHAMNNRGSTAQIIEREGWKTQKDFVGHRKAVTCVRFNPHLFTKTVKEKQNHYSCVAIGSRDQTLSIWCTRSKRPLVVLHDLFNESILDISWSSEGFSLMSCSSDGTVVYIEFDESEIGTRLTLEAKSSYIKKLYGKSLQSSSDSFLVEDPEILKVREEHQKKLEDSQAKLQEQKFKQTQQLHSVISNGSNESGSKSNAGDSGGSFNRLMKGPIDKQIETRMPDGRRRITPLYIPPPTNCDGTPIPFSSQQTTFSSSTESNTKIHIEKRNELSSKTSPNSPPHASYGQHSQTSLSQAQLENTSINTFLNTSQNTSPIQQPQLQQPSSSSLKNQSNLSTKCNNNHDSESPQMIAQSLQQKKNNNKTCHNSSQQNKSSTKSNESTPEINILSSTKKKSSEKSFEKESFKKKQSRSAQSLVKPKPYLTSTPINSKIDDKVTMEKSTVSSKSAESRLQFPALKVDKSSSINVSINDDIGSRTLVVEIENNLNSSSICALRLSDHENEKQWEVLLSSKIIGLAGCEYLIAIACEDSTISVFSTQTGRRLQPPILINSCAAKLNCYKYFVMVITTKATLWVWNFNKHSILVKNEPLGPLFTSSLSGSFNSELSLTDTRITETGCPLVSLSSGKSYVFDIPLSSWSLISNTQDLLNYSSDYKPSWISEPSSYPLAVIQSQQKFMKLTHNLFLTNAGLQQSGTLSFIDQQLASSFVIGSSKEYRYWLITLAQYLTEEGLELRLRELCQYLLGPPFKSSSSKWENTILGNEKHELLQEILSITTSNLKLQRIYTEFKQQLDLVL